MTLVCCVPAGSIGEAEAAPAKRGSAAVATGECGEGGKQDSQAQEQSAGNSQGGLVKANVGKPAPQIKEAPAVATQAPAHTARNAETSARALKAAYEALEEMALPFVPYAPVFSVFL